MIRNILLLYAYTLQSMCLKRYCECFSGGVKCGAKCQCTGCLNREEFVVYENTIEGKRDSNALSGGPVGSPPIPTYQRDERLQAAAGDETAAVLNELSRTPRMTAAVLNELSRTPRMTMGPMIGESMADSNGEMKDRPAKRHQVLPDEKTLPDQKVSITLTNDMILKKTKHIILMKNYIYILS